uniref:Uncharacterized protein AlNc14C179G8190 n=1 Tax=Albugo laibachii Nc14 TaxID=890382 RepID=F0WEM2_9STRA|nr:hypothetical protein PITG_08560 [Albugo laibachii Nc14]CCA23086.1 hypothetical protein PITG_08560 [Albugo laibachii Nc14]|eukprot:CCA23086.1 hypothetical protein PITG_08560 [Albugo laibachii Nc14]
MAFFGITILGAQNPFDETKATPLHAFSEQDFQRAFLETYQPGFRLYSEDEDVAIARREAIKTANINHAQLREFLINLYNCPQDIDNVPNLTYVNVDEAFYDLVDKDISLALLQQRLERARMLSLDQEQKSLESVYSREEHARREFISGQDFRTALAKHQRMVKDPIEKSLVSMTESQTYGWHKPSFKQDRRPKQSCEETKFASAMTKAGMYYY